MFKSKRGFTVIEIAVVIAIVAVIAGVWYVSKNKAGADVAMPGIGNTGGTKPGGKTTPLKMGMGRIKGQVFESSYPDYNPKPSSLQINFYRGTCSTVQTEVFYYDAVTYRVESDVKGYYSLSGVQPGSYCGVIAAFKGTKKKDVGVTFGGTTTVDWLITYN